MGLKAWFARLVASRDEVNAAEERERTACMHVTPIAETWPREMVEVGGVIRTVTLQAHGQQVEAEAELYDGSAALRLVWLGQRAVTGIEPGQRVRVRGRLALMAGQTFSIPTTNCCLVPHPDPTPPPAAGPLGQVLGKDTFNLVETIGGWRGLAEATVPGLVFVVVFVVTTSIWPAGIAAAAVSVGFILARALAGSDIKPALNGLVGVLIGLAWARLTGRQHDYFAGGLWMNAVYGVVVVGTIVVRWPLVGIIMGFVSGQSWRDQPALRRRYAIATWVLATMFALRLAVQVPLYLAGSIAALGTAKLVMGLPLTALVVWLVWLIARRPAPAAAAPDPR